MSRSSPHFHSSGRKAQRRDCHSLSSPRCQMVARGCNPAARGASRDVHEPHEHDRQAAVGQAGVPLLAQAMRDAELPRSVTMQSFDLLMPALELLRDDLPEVIGAVLQGNPFAKSVALKLASGIGQLMGQESNPDTGYPNCPDDGRFSRKRCASHPARCGAAHSNAGRDSAPMFQDRMQDRLTGSDGSGPAP